MKYRYKLCVALITNKDKRRYEYVQPHLKRLNKSLAEKYDVEYTGHAWQPMIEPHALSLVLKKRYGNWKRNRDWVRYREMSPRIILFDLLVLIRRLLIVVVNRKVECRWNNIDSYITDKHIRAWSNFLETDSDLLICFEDDVLFKKDSITRLQRLLKKFLGYSKKLIYIDIAGGSNLNVLKIWRFESKRDHEYIYFRKPFANTACGYIINRLTAEMFLDSILKDPNLRQVSIDHLINRLFVILEDHKFFCCHSYPTIFSHGSIIEQYPTTTGAPW